MDNNQQMTEFSEGVHAMAGAVLAAIELVEEKVWDLDVMKSWIETIAIHTELSLITKENQDAPKT